MKGHFVYQWVLEEMAFFAITLDSWEHSKATPASYSSVSWGFRQQSRRKRSWEVLLCGDKDHGKATRTQGLMGRLNVKSEKAIPAFSSSLDSLCRNYHQKSGQEAAGYKGGVICEYLAYWYLCLPVYYIQLFRAKLSEKNVHATIPNGNMGYEQYTVPDDSSCRTYSVLLLSFSTRKHIFMASRASLSNFLWRTVNSKLPTIPIGVVACAFSDNLSRNSCIRCAYLHSFRCEWEKNNIPTICWPSSELNNKCSHVTN